MGNDKNIGPIIGTFENYKEMEGSDVDYYDIFVVLDDSDGYTKSSQVVHYVYDSDESEFVLVGNQH